MAALHMHHILQEDRSANSTAASSSSANASKNSSSQELRLYVDLGIEPSACAIFRPSGLSVYVDLSAGDPLPSRGGLPAPNRVGLRDASAACPGFTAPDPNPTPEEAVPREERRRVRFSDVITVFEFPRDTPNRCSESAHDDDFDREPQGHELLGSFDDVAGAQEEQQELPERGGKRGKEEKDRNAMEVSWDEVEEVDRNPSDGFGYQEKAERTAFDGFEVEERAERNVFDGVGVEESGESNAFDGFGVEERAERNAFDGVGDDEKAERNAFHGVEVQERAKRNAFHGVGFEERAERNAFEGVGVSEREERNVYDGVGDEVKADCNISDGSSSGEEEEQEQEEVAHDRDENCSSSSSSGRGDEIASLNAMEVSVAHELLKLQLGTVELMSSRGGGGGGGGGEQALPDHDGATEMLVSIRCGRDFRAGIHPSRDCRASNRIPSGDSAARLPPPGDSPGAVPSSSKMDLPSADHGGGIPPSDDTMEVPSGDLAASSDSPRSAPPWVDSGGRMELPADDFGNRKDRRTGEEDLYNASLRLEELSSLVEQIYASLPQLSSPVGVPEDGPWAMQISDDSRKLTLKRIRPHFRSDRVDQRSRAYDLGPADCEDLKSRVRDLANADCEGLRSRARDLANVDCEGLRSRARDLADVDREDLKSRGRDRVGDDEEEEEGLEVQDRCSRPPWKRQFRSLRKLTRMRGTYDEIGRENPSDLRDSER